LAQVTVVQSVKFSCPPSAIALLPTMSAPLDISSLVNAADNILKRGSGAQQIFQDLVAMCTTVRNANHGDLATADKVFKSTFVTDAEVGTITDLIPVNMGCPNDGSALQHEARVYLALFLLQEIAGDPVNTAVFLATHHGIHPLLKLQSSIRLAHATGQRVSHTTLKHIVMVLARLHKSLSLFCTEEVRQVLNQNGEPSYNMEHHAVVAWDGIQKHIFVNATDEASRCQRLEVLWNLDYGRLLAKVDITLRDVLDPLHQQHDAGNCAGQSQNKSIRHPTRKFDSLVSVSHKHIHGQTSQIPQHSQRPMGPLSSTQQELQPPAMQVFHNSDTTHIQGSKLSSSKRRTPTPNTSCDRAGITDRRFAGRVLCFDPEKNFGFISCSELREVFAKDMWVHKEQLHGFLIGQLVIFTVVINKHGHPQAVDLVSLACMEFDHPMCFSV